MKKTVTVTHFVVKYKLKKLFYRKLVKLARKCSVVNSQKKEIRSFMKIMTQYKLFFVMFICHRKTYEAFFQRIFLVTLSMHYDNNITSSNNVWIIHYSGTSL